MSASEVERFAKDVKGNPALGDQVKVLGADLDGLVRFANGKGYQFTKQELEAKAKDNQGMLNEEQLNKAAGGVKANQLVVTFVTVT